MLIFFISLVTQAGIGGVESARPTVAQPATGGIVSGTQTQPAAQGTPTAHSPHPVLQHTNNPTPSVRQRVSLGGLDSWRFAWRNGCLPLASRAEIKLVTD